ncbi:hypothetical protein CK475_08050 [Enterobacter cloacae]|nr:hypothetical protein CK475_08050 [Enterobacter cloacae]
MEADKASNNVSTVLRYQAPRLDLLMTRKMALHLPVCANGSWVIHVANLTVMNWLKDSPLT